VVVTWTPSAAGISTRIEPADPIVRNEEPSEDDCLSEIGNEDDCLDLYGFWGIKPYAPGFCVHWQEITHPYYRNVECVEGDVLSVDCPDTSICLLRFTNLYQPYSAIVSVRTDTERAYLQSLVGNCVLATGYNAARDGNSWMRVHDLDDVVPYDY
jgi:hypothetical protein